MEDKQTDPENAVYLSGQLLIAMPQMEDPRFSRTVIYICSHTKEGAMGIILNRFAENINFCDLMEQLNLPVISENENIPVHFGGPMETGRGFVLHSADFTEEASLLIEDSIALTATVDMLRAISDGTGPKKSILALFKELHLLNEKISSLESEISKISSKKIDFDLKLKKIKTQKKRKRL